MGVMGKPAIGMLEPISKLKNDIPIAIACDKVPGIDGDIPKKSAV